MFVGENDGKRIGNKEDWGIDVDDIDKLIKGNVFKFSAYSPLSWSHNDHALIFDAHTFALQPK